MDFLKKLNKDLVEKSNEVQSQIQKQVNSTVLKLRTHVSDDRIRFINESYNLDLSYITNRIIAMSFPSAESFSTDYIRNSRVEVKKFLDQYHPQHYLIINLTEKPYDTSYYGGRVHHIGIIDNQAPSLGILLYAIQVIHKWLSEDETNVVAIHCLAGLGRTGVLICSYLLTAQYQGRQMEAISLFANQRTTSKIGVKVPSQLRYIDYIDQLTASRRPVDAVQNPFRMKLKSIIIRPSPLVSQKSGVWKPTIELFNFAKPLEQQLLLSTKELDSGPFSKNQNDNICKVQGDVVMIDTQSVVVQGDILLKIYHGFSQILSSNITNVILDKPSLRLSFHTSFVDNYCLDFNKTTIDEKDNCIKSENFAEDFTIRLLFSPCDESSAPPPQQYYQQQQQQQPSPSAPNLSKEQNSNYNI